AVPALGGALTGWTWSYTSNQQRAADVGAEFDKAAAMQQGEVGLQSRIEPLLVVQDRLEQLQAWRDEHPVSLGLGLYQGEAIEAKLRDEYFHGMRQLMLVPVGTKLESFLGEVIARRGELKPPSVAGSTSGDPTQVGEVAQAGEPGLYQDASPTDSQDAYNAPKPY